MVWWQALVATAAGIVLSSLFALALERIKGRAQARDKRFDTRVAAFEELAAWTETKFMLNEVEDRSRAPKVDLYVGLRAVERIRLVGSPETYRAALALYNSVRGDKTSVGFGNDRSSFFRAARRDLGVD